MGDPSSMRFHASRSCSNVRISLGKGRLSGFISLVAYSWRTTLRPGPGLGLPWSTVDYGPGI